jgi:ubiquinone biosynthesis protein COQ4
VLTGYGRDALGEASLLGFSYEQNHNKGILFIAYAGARQIKKVSGTKAPLFAAIKEGRKLGRAAAKIAHQDIAGLMAEDIAAARARLSIGKPEVYRQCLAILQSEGVAREELTLGGAGAQAA